MSKEKTAVSPIPIYLALTLDTLLVVGFVTLGRITHGKDTDLQHIAQTAIPFLLGAWAAWLCAQMWRKNPCRIWLGVHVAVIAEICGQLGFLAFNGKTEVSFIIASTIALLIFLVGWRGIVFLVQKTRKQ